MSGRLLRDEKSLWCEVDDAVEGKAWGGGGDGADVVLALFCAGVERDDLRRSG